MTEADDLEAIVHAIEEAQNLLKGHLELTSMDALTTITGVHELLSAPVLSEALEQIRLRFLSKSLKQD